MFSQVLYSTYIVGTLKHQSITVNHCIDKIGAFFSPLSLKVMQKDLSVVLFTILMHSEAVPQWLPNVKLTNHPLTLAITRVPS